MGRTCTDAEVTSCAMACESVECCGRPEPRQAFFGFPQMSVQRKVQVVSRRSATKLPDDAAARTPLLPASTGVSAGLFFFPNAYFIPTVGQELRQSKQPTHAAKSICRFLAVDAPGSANTLAQSAIDAVLVVNCYAE